jgi:hypothetical protein
MSRKTLDPGFVSAALACRWAGVKQPTHAGWAANGLVRNPGPSGCDRADCLEVTAVAQLTRWLTLEDTRIAWHQARAQVRELDFVPQVLDLVWDDERQQVHLSDGVSNLADLVRHGRLIRVIQLADALAATRAAYDRAVADQWLRRGKLAGERSGSSHAV